MLHFINTLIPLLLPFGQKQKATKDLHQSGAEIEILFKLALSWQLKSLKKKRKLCSVVKHGKRVTLFSASAGWGLVQEDACAHARFSSAAHSVAPVLTEVFIPVSAERNAGFQTQYVDINSL